MGQGGRLRRRLPHALHRRGRQGPREEEVQVQQVGQLLPACRYACCVLHAMHAGADFEHFG